MSIRDTDWFKFAVTQSITHPEALEWLYETAFALSRPLIASPHQRFPVQAAEIGSWMGGSAIVLAEAISQSCFGGRLCCFENWSGFNGKDGERTFGTEVRKAFYKNLEPYMGDGLGIVAVNELGSPVGASALTAGQIDLLFVDGRHDYDSVMTDLKAFVPKVRPGGIVCGHDYQGEPGVARAVMDYFRGPDADNLLGVRTAPGDLWYVEIPK